MGNYFNSIVVNTIVLSTAHGLGVVRAVQESKRHGHVITVLFGRPQSTSFSKMYDSRGCVIENGEPATTQTLFYIDDTEMIKIDATMIQIAPTFENTFYDKSYAGMKVYDTLYGWGDVVELSCDSNKVLNVCFRDKEGRCITKSYDRYGCGMGGICRDRRLFNIDEMKNGTFAQHLNNMVKGDNAPEVMVRMKSQFVLSVPTKTEPAKEPAKGVKKMWVFFYKPKNTSGYLKNVMIGTGQGVTVLDALEELYREESTYIGTTTRGDVFDDIIKRGEFDRIFCYEATHVGQPEKETMACVEHSIKAQLHGANGRVLLKAIRQNHP